MKDFTKGNEAKLIFNFTIPMLLGNVFQQLYNIVDSIIVGNYLGKEALAAVGASFPIIFGLIAMIIGVGSGFSIIISQFYGAKKMSKVKLSIETMCIFIFFASIIISFIGRYFSEDFFVLLKLPPELLDQAMAYLDTYMYGMLFFFGFSGISSVLRGLGDSKTPLYFLIAASVLNVVLDLLFVIVFDYGIAGAAWASILAQGIVFVVSIVYLNKTHEVLRFSDMKLRFNKDIFIRSLKIGLPSGMQNSFVAFGMMALLSVVNTFGTNVIAAYAVATRIESLAVMPSMNFSQAIAAFVGQNLGAGKIERIYKGYKATLILSNALCLIISLIIVFSGTFLMGLFINDQEIIALGHRYLIIVGSFYLLFSTMFVSNGVLRGAGDTLIPMFITLFALWGVRIPLAYLFSGMIGEEGIWWSVPCGWMVGMVFSFLYFRLGRWKKLKI